MTANDSSVVFNFVTQQCRSCANGKRLLRPRKWSDLAGRGGLPWQRDKPGQMQAQALRLQRLRPLRRRWSAVHDT